jgi:hypothetical protein
MKVLCCDCLLGTDWIRDNLFTLDFHHLQLIICDKTRYASAHLVTDAEKIGLSVLLLRKTTIPPYSVRERKVDDIVDD